MKVFINKYIPFHGYIAMALYGVIIWRKEYEYKYNTEYIRNQVINHESIHVAQMRDFCKWLPIGGTIFYLIYVFEWLWRLLFTKSAFFLDNNAYRMISFEQEAKNNEKNMDYLSTRKHFAQWKTLKDN